MGPDTASVMEALIASQNDDAAAEFVQAISDAMNTAWEEISAAIDDLEHPVLAMSFCVNHELTDKIMQMHLPAAKGKSTTPYDIIGTIYTDMSNVTGEPVLGVDMGYMYAGADFSPVISSNTPAEGNYTVFDHIPNTMEMIETALIQDTPMPYVVIPPSASGYDKIQPFIDPRAGMPEKIAPTRVGGIQIAMSNAKNEAAGEPDPEQPNE